MNEKPWLQGPKELLQHAATHLDNGSEFDYRIALISIDNAVELTMRTFLTLPRRITNVQISSKEKKEYLDNFHSLVTGIEKKGRNCIVGIELGDIEFYHQQRNKLYHEALGITIEKANVESYLSISKKLFSNLFSLNVDDNSTITEFDDFIKQWSRFEKSINRIRKIYFRSKSNLPLSVNIEKLQSTNLFPDIIIDQFNQLMDLRNRYMHTPGVVVKTEKYKFSKHLDNVILWLETDYNDNLIKSISDESLGIHSIPQTFDDVGDI